jgi:hypothetical protein
VDVIVHLAAVRPGRLAAGFRDEVLAETVRDLREVLRGARAEEIPGGVRLVLERDLTAIAELADQIRAIADTWPFLAFRLLADAPLCWLEVTGTGPASGVARSVFGGLVE